jgi:hypothetical protein
MMRVGVVLAVWVAGCAGGAPVVEVVSATPDTLSPNDDAHDDLSIAVHYEDSDGDLGGGEALVFDCRSDAVVTVLDIPPIANELAVEEGVAIEGELLLSIPDVGELARGELPVACQAAPQGAFCVVLVDLDGNHSEPSCTGRIVVD